MLLKYYLCHQRSFSTQRYRLKNKLSSYLLYQKSLQKSLCGLESFAAMISDSQLFLFKFFYFFFCASHSLTTPQNVTQRARQASLLNFVYLCLPFPSSTEVHLRIITWLYLLYFINNSRISYIHIWILSDPDDYT